MKYFLGVLALAGTMFGSVAVAKTRTNALHYSVPTGISQISKASSTGTAHRSTRISATNKTKGAKASRRTSTRKAKTARSTGTTKVRKAKRASKPKTGQAITAAAAVSTNPAISSVKKHSRSKKHAAGTGSTKVKRARKPKASGTGSTQPNPNVNLQMPTSGTSYDLNQSGSSTPADNSQGIGLPGAPDLNS